MSATGINNQIAAVLARLSNRLEPTELFRELTMNYNKGNLDNDTLAHAYYTLYYNREHAPISRPVSSSLLDLYGRRPEPPTPTPSLAVVKQTNPNVYVSSVCDAILTYDTPVIPPQVFCQAIRNIHPHELKNDYYHLPEICGSTFEEHLMMVNDRLRRHFSHNDNLDDIFNGINKCLCLRMLSSNMYYYRDNPAELEPAIAKLLVFYTNTDFLHASSDEVFHAHLHMIRKFKQLKGLIEELVNPNFKKFLELSKYVFGEIHVESDHFRIRVVDTKGIMFELPVTNVSQLKSHIEKLLTRNRNSMVVPPRMSSKDMIHTMDKYRNPENARVAFDEGIRFMTVLMRRLDTEKDKLTRSEVYELIHDLGELYELTLEPFSLLEKTKMITPADNEKIYRMMEKMDEYDAQYRSTELNPTKVYLKKLEDSQKRRSRSRSPSQSGGAKTNSKKHNKHKKHKKSKHNKSKKHRKTKNRNA